jgi:serine O-acetyltransferase
MDLLVSAGLALGIPDMISEIPATRGPEAVEAPTVAARVEVKPIEPKMSLIALIKEDVWRNGGWHRPGARAMVAYRCAHSAQAIRTPVLGPIIRRITTSMLRYARNSYGIELYATMKIGRRLAIAHQSAIILHEFAIIGDDCIVRHGVTMGIAGQGNFYATPENAPVIGNEVDIGAGAVLLGAVKIGDGARIFPNALVVTDVPARATVMTAVGRVMPFKPAD